MTSQESKEKLTQVLGVLGFDKSIIRNVIEQIYSENEMSSENVAKIRRDKIRRFLTELAIPANLLGYQYLQDAINLVITDEMYVHKVTTELYPKIADKFNTTPSRAERAIRNSIDKAHKDCPEELWEFYFGSTVRMTNSAFIAKAAEIVKG